jgi:hypothetical protein
MRLNQPTADDPGETDLERLAFSCTTAVLSARLRYGAVSSNHCICTAAFEKHALLVLHIASTTACSSSQRCSTPSKKKG